MIRTVKLAITVATSISILAGAAAPAFSAPPGGWTPGGIHSPTPMPMPGVLGGSGPRVIEGVPRDRIFPRPLPLGTIEPPGSIGGPATPPGPGASPTPPAPHTPDRHRHRDRAFAAGALGFMAGALISGAMANQRAQAVSNELPSWWVAACAKRYRSYDYETNTFLKRNGRRYWCDPR